jgi:hypothetical protein
MQALGRYERQVLQCGLAMPHKRYVEGSIPLTKISQGRPKYRWQDIKQDICQMKIKNWIARVQDREKWKEVIEKAKTFN